ncbi:hypothetical protein CCZ01_00950 [Helicobacter monodelphidis]|uniref:hypothetical protein n=1 Tax=Helicobacter sp. 15-1451 TaxID=2004995 RepID=UPI000DCD2A25|nr:hypothetical protein [Helicobacter sp. 15-1451]RAX59333.1 hypothetical protein CCZ01_00950 [Helicobacter sp. 15-1451]
MSNKEKRGIYNVTFNDKNSTPINAELEAIENAIIDYVIHYVKGYHNIKRDIGLGAKHIKLHLEKNSEGQITLEELLSLGNSIREYLKVFKEPFIDEKEAKIYEWENNKGIRFRAITDKITGGYLERLTKSYQRGGSQPPLSPSDEIIITFYSDRNLNKQMEFKNPKVEEYYAQEAQQNKSVSDFKTKLEEFNTKNNANNKNLER